jgi:hypothetical protein
VELLSILRLLVTFTGQALSFPLLVVKSGEVIKKGSSHKLTGMIPLAMLLLPPLDVPE